MSRCFPFSVLVAQFLCFISRSTGHILIALAVAVSLSRDLFFTAPPSFSFFFGRSASAAPFGAWIFLNAAPALSLPSGCAMRFLPKTAFFPLTTASAPHTFPPSFSPRVYDARQFPPWNDPSFVQAGPYWSHGPFFSDSFPLLFHLKFGTDHEWTSSFCAWRYFHEISNPSVGKVSDPSPRNTFLAFNPHVASGNVFLARFCHWKLLLTSWTAPSKFFPPPCYDRLRKAELFPFLTSTRSTASMSFPPPPLETFFLRHFSLQGLSEPRQNGFFGNSRTATNPITASPLSGLSCLVFSSTIPIPAFPHLPWKFSLSIRAGAPFWRGQCHFHFFLTASDTFPQAPLFPCFRTHILSGLFSAFSFFEASWKSFFFFVSLAPMSFRSGCCSTRPA